MVSKWGNNGNSERLYFLGSKITADGDCSHEIKRPLLLERKAMTILDGALKSRDITLATKVHLVKAVVFPQFVVTHTVKVFSIVNKAEVDIFLELSCFFDDPTDVGNLISGSSASSKSILNI